MPNNIYFCILHAYHYSPVIASFDGCPARKALINYYLWLSSYFYFLQANLIMRVLKLTDEEMALLPAEHRQSILALKDQIAKSAGKK